MADATVIRAVTSRKGSRPSLHLVFATAPLARQREALAEIFPTVDAFFYEPSDIPRAGVDLDPQVFLIPKVDVALGFANGVEIGSELALELAEAQDFVRQLLGHGNDVTLFVSFE
ncbi:MAG TPA: hypothetical protein P5256_01530 [Beijerinckiaceae bacterium]|nr:hypothetical protein [Rhodoblastus sp.]MCC2106159.1 hypothetical protein [Hyphomicrobiales bacterium]HPG02549.1 hypothetical protein [Rhodoblastus sp.]HRY01777.1 hypothetical protein [Beijerinckiaceae bacterium]